MHWVEDLFGIAPDGGQGSFELMIILVAFSLGLGVVVKSLRRALVRPRAESRLVEETLLEP